VDGSHPDGSHQHVHRPLAAPLHNQHGQWHSYTGQYRLCRAPTNQASDQEKDAFYTRLEEVYEQSPKHDIVLLRGDFNAKIGERAPIAQYALGERNENGDRLVQFAQANGLCAANALVKRSTRRLYTWRSKPNWLLLGPPQMVNKCGQVSIISKCRRWNWNESHVLSYGHGSILYLWIISSSLSFMSEWVVS